MDFGNGPKNGSAQMDMKTGSWVVWCLACQRRYETLAGTRDAAVELGRGHTQETRHGVWLERRTKLESGDALIHPPHATHACTRLHGCHAAPCVCRCGEACWCTENLLSGAGASHNSRPPRETPRPRLEELVATPCLHAWGTK